MTNILWTKDKLYCLAQEKLGDSPFLVVSNREPYQHSWSGGKIIASRPVGGLTQALDPVLRAAGGIWIAHGSGDPDREAVDACNRVRVPPEKPEYTLRRVWLTESEVEGFYRGFSNEALWPLCHVAFIAPVFREPDWKSYQHVNRLFADAVGAEAGSRPAVVFLQDYHLALVARLLKKRNPRLTIGQFWHIPWPSYDIFRTCPWHEEILIGLLGNDLLGFHTREYCELFLETAACSLPVTIDKKKSVVTYRGHTTLVKPFPISVDFESLATEAASREVTREMARLRRELNLGGKCAGIGIDRLDYTKGIPERLRALDKFFEDCPAYRGKVVFLQSGMPSRSQIDNYRAVDREIESLVEVINCKYGNNDWQPVIALRGQLTSATMAAMRRLAQFCVVSSRHDGMNLVAKEFVASRVDNDGVLLLSRFTGAAVELKAALPVNPFDVGGFAEAVRKAIEMPAAEQIRRMKAMRETVAVKNIYRWGADIVSRLASLSQRQ